MRSSVRGCSEDLLDTIELGFNLVTEDRAPVVIFRLACLSKIAAYMTKQYMYWSLDGKLSVAIAGTR